MNDTDDIEQSYRVDTPISEGSTHHVAPPFQMYIRMREDLFVLRGRNGGKESEGEDLLLDTMDVVWEKLSKEEREKINKLPGDQNARAHNKVPRV